jgi:protease IV
MRFLGGFFRGLWHGLDVFRRVLHLILLLALFAVVIVALRGAAPKLPERGVLLIRPAGQIVEQLSGEPLARAINEAQGQAAPETLLWDLTEAIRAGASDKRVQALLIETDDMTGAGQAKLEELAAAIAEFKAAGKKVIARGGSFEQSHYYLAAQADEVYLDPMGLLVLQGYGRYQPYLKEALDKLAVDIHLFRAGKFKSAAEPLIRSDMSAEDREETLTYLQALWSGYRSAVARARGKTPEDISAYAEQIGANAVRANGDMAAVAKAAGLVTDIKTAAEVDRRLVELVGVDKSADDPDAFPMIEVADYLKLVHTEEKLRNHKNPAVGVVIASGEIQDGEQPPGTIGGVSTAELLHQARLDNDIEAVVLRVDSPGGSVFASEQIYREVLALKAAGKSVVVSMSDLAASGGYYIAAPADEIIASPNTLTGSIGVFGVFPTIDRSLGKLGVRTDGVGTTPLSGALSINRPVSPLVEQLFQGSINHTYEQFLARVASGRHKTRDQIDAIAQGRVWAGSDALKIGLIDRFGTYHDALAAAAKRAGLGADYRVKILEPKLSFAEQLVFRMQSQAAVWLRTSGLYSATTLHWAQRMQPLDREMQRLERFARTRSALVYCFCGVE